MPRNSKARPQIKQGSAAGVWAEALELSLDKNLSTIIAELLTQFGPDYLRWQLRSPDATNQELMETVRSRLALAGEEAQEIGEQLERLLCGTSTPTAPQPSSSKKAIAPAPPPVIPAPEAMPPPPPNLPTNLPSMADFL